MSSSIFNLPLHPIIADGELKFLLSIIGAKREKRRKKKKTAKYEITRRGWVVEKDKIQSQVIENQVENMDGDQSLDRNAGVLQTV